jgi:hypothetical protein
MQPIHLNKALRAAAAAAILALTAACASIATPEQDQKTEALQPPEAGPPAETVLARAPAPPAQPAAPAPTPRPAAPPPAPESAPSDSAETPGPEGSIALEGGDPGVTAELVRAREALVVARTMNARMQREMQDLQKQLAAKDAQILRLQMQTEQFKERADKLETKLSEWQKDVLGFRDEIRDMNRAQAQILEKVVTLLQNMDKTPEAGK